MAESYVVQNVVGSPSGTASDLHTNWASNPQPPYMTLRRRLTLGLLTIAVILIVPLIVATFSLDRVRDEALLLRDEDFAASLLLGRLREALNDLRAAELAVLFVRDEKSREAMVKRVHEIRSFGDQLQRFGLDRAARDVRLAMADIAAAEPAEFEAAVAGRAKEAERISAERVIPAITRAEGAAVATERILRERTRLRVEHATQHALNGYQVAGLGLIFAIIGAALIAFKLTQSVSKPVYELERGMRRVADGELDAKVAISPSRTDEFGRLAASFEDMTRQLAELDKLKAEFVSVASHELKTPINVILGYTQLLQEDLYGQLNDKQRGVADVLEKQARTLARLVKQLLDVTRFEAGGGKLDVRPLELRGFMHNLEEAFQVLADQRGIRFLVSLDESLPPTVHWDADRVNEVLGNLVSNALKFTERGGEVTVTVSPTDHSVQMEVRDTGAGIPEDQIPRIFDKFYQASNQDSADQAGTGLGLAIARQIVEAHGGTITCDSETGIGTTFTISLPLHAQGRRSSAAHHAVAEVVG